MKTKCCSTFKFYTSANKYRTSFLFFNSCANTSERASYYNLSQYVWHNRQITARCCNL